MEYELMNGFIVFGLSDKYKRILDMLITCDVEADDFVANYLMNGDDEERAINQYRAKRITEEGLTKQVFSQMLNRDRKEALERLFLQPLTEQEFGFIEELVEDGTTSYEKIYDNVQENPRGNWKRLLL